MIPTQDVSGERSFRPHAGGAVFNTAIALGRLGVNASFLAGLSTDLFGKLLVEELHKSNVETDLALFSSRPTTLAFVELNGGNATYTFYDENTSGRTLDPGKLPSIPAIASALYFGGISLVNEPAADFYLALLLREAGVRPIILDPNIRTSFILDENRYRNRLDQLIAHADILKVSDEDLDWIVPGQLTQIEKASILRERGPEVVVLTRGSDGAVALFADDRTVQVPVHRVTVADTVGAGDTFNAGLIACLEKDDLLHKDRIGSLTADNLKRALEYGARVAGVTVSRHGANPPWDRELKPEQIEGKERDVY